MRFLRQVVDTAELVTAGQVFFVAAVAIVIAIAGAAGAGFAWRVFVWAS